MQSVWLKERSVMPRRPCIFTAHVVIAMVFLIQVPCFADSTIVFNEIMYHPTGEEERLEWVELHNQMSVDVDISGWSIRGGVEYDFPTGTIVSRGGFVVIAIAPTALVPVPPGSQTLGPFTGRLANDGERLELRNNSDRLMDWIDYDDTDSWPVGPDGSGMSLAKMDPDSASPPSLNWTSSLVRGGTPGTHNFRWANPSHEIALVPIDATWRYATSVVGDEETWQHPTFNDASWPAASAVFFRTPPTVPVEWVGAGNRTAPQDFGFSPQTNNAGGVTPGEVGGHIDRSPNAWYGDDDIGELDLATMDLTASVRWLQGGAGNPMFGYFQGDGSTLGGEPNGLYWAVDDLNLYLGASHTEEAESWHLVGSLTSGVRSTVTMNWAASTQTWTVTLEDGPSRSLVVSDAPALNLDWFGIRSLSESEGSGVTFWADDIEYTIGGDTPIQRLQEFGEEGPPAGSQTELLDSAATHYFRTTFEIGDDVIESELQLQSVVQDGAIVYLNGVEVHRENLPGGPVVSSTPAVSDRDAFTIGPPVNLPPGALRSGINILAVEVHQSPEGDDHFAFGLLLSLLTRPTGDSGWPLIAIHELPSPNGNEFWIELFNASDSSVDLANYSLQVAGAGSSVYVFPETLIPAGGYFTVTRETLAFDVTADDRLFLFSPDGSTLIDAAVVSASARARMSSENVQWLAPASLTPGAENVFDLNDSIVINEVMYHQRPLQNAPSDPTSTTSPRESPEAWIELYNRGRTTIDLAGWELREAVDFQFDPETRLSPGEFLVVAKDASYLQQVNPEVRIAGEFDRELSHRSDRILLIDDHGNPADEVEYFDWGYWPELADGGGSSLELRDPWADNRRPEAWASSNESGKTSWRRYSYRGMAMSVVPGDPADPPILQLGFLDGAGVVLIDDVSVIKDPEGVATELITNGTFTGGSGEGWSFLGNHRQTRVISDPDNPDNFVLALTGVGPTEYLANHASTVLVETAPDGVTYEISYRARWLEGSNQLNSRLYFNRLPRTTFVDVPGSGGTPGALNSRRTENLGPSYWDLSHFPTTPSVGRPVTVSVHLHDPQGVASATLWWAANEGRWHSTPMEQQGEDEFTASIPGQNAAAVVQFYVEAMDFVGGVAFSPPAGPQSRALYVVEDGQGESDDVYTFRTIQLPSEATFMYEENMQSNERVGGTVVWRERQSYYDVGIRLRGSLIPGRSQSTVGHNVRFQPDRLFRGVHSTVSIDRNQYEIAGLKEIVLLHVITHAGDMPGMYNDIVHAIAPLPGYTSRAMLRLAGQGDVFLESQYENGSAGTIFESSVLRVDDHRSIDFIDLGDDKEFYRWIFDIQNNRTSDDYSGLMALAKTLGMPEGPELEARADEIMDVDEWMRVFAMQALGGVRDTYLEDGNHNFRVYARPSDGKMLAFPWDIDGAFTTEVSTPFPWGQGNLTKVIERTPYSRLFYGHLHDMVNTTFNRAYLSYWTSHYGQLADQDFSYILDFVDARVADAEQVLPRQVPFALTGDNSAELIVEGPGLALEGTGWLNIREIRLEGSNAPLELTWTDLQTWQAEIPLDSGLNTLKLVAYDYQGLSVGEVTVQVTRRSEQ